MYIDYIYAAEDKSSPDGWRKDDKKQVVIPEIPSHCVTAESGLSRFVTRRASKQTRQAPQARVRRRITARLFFRSIVAADRIFASLPAMRRRWRWRSSGGRCGPGPSLVLATRRLAVIPWGRYWNHVARRHCKKHDASWHW